MPRPKPPRPLRNFNARCPPEELEALPAIVRAWEATVVAQMAAQGVQVPPLGVTAWFRTMLRAEAARYGVTIPEVGPPVAASKPRPRRTRPARKAAA